MGYKSVRLNGSNLKLREFKLDWFAPNPAIAMIAKRRSGKSWVCRNILKHFSNIPGGVIIAPTDKLSSFYGEFFPGSFIHYVYSSELIQRILERQQIMIRKSKQKASQGKKVDPRAYLIMDDCLASKGSWMKDEPIMEMFFNGRHFQIMYILTMQFPLGISPELRGNFDYVFLLAEDIVSNQKRLFDHYAGIFPNFQAFKAVFAQVTANHGSMIIVNKGATAEFTEKVFWFKATDSPIKMGEMGCRQFQEFHNKNYDPNWRDRTFLNKSTDLNTMFEVKRGQIPKVTVEKQFS